MAFVSSPITSYKVVLYGNKEGQQLGAFIHCYHANKNVMSALFYNDESSVPNNHWAGEGYRVELKYPMSKFASIIDLLRNEKPLYFGYISDNSLGYISTHAEPTGEEES